MKRRILMLLENCPFPRDPRVRHEARALTDAGFSVTLICPHSTGQAWSENYCGTRVIRYPVPPKFNNFIGYICEYGYSLFIFFVLSVYVWARYGIDAVHVHQPPDTGLLVAGFFKLFGKAYVMDHHDLAPELYNAHFLYRGKPAIYRALMWWEKKALHLADRVIATNESYKQIEIERAGISEEKITIVRNGPDLNEKPLRANLLDQKKPDDGITLGYVGVMGIQDGVDYLLKAFQLLVHELHQENVRCVLVGAGDAFLQMKQLSSDLGIDKHVEFTGWIDDPNEFNRHLERIDIGLSPEPSNAYNDTSTFIKVMDYMTFGKPLVAFDLPESRHSAGEAALYADGNDIFDFAQKIVMLMEDEERRRQMGAVGLERIRDELAWNHQAGKLVEMYRSLLNAHAGDQG